MTYVAAKRTKRNSIQSNFLRVWQIILTPAIQRGSILACILLMSAVATISTQTGVSLAQQPPAPSETNRAAAEQAIREGIQLYHQSTAASLRQAVEKFKAALSLYRMAGDRARETADLNNIGRVYSDLGEKQKALSFYNQALSLSQVLGNRSEEATALNNIGLVYQDLGEKQKALQYLNQALPLSQTLGDKAGVAATLTNIGGVYSDLREKQKALDFYNRALPLWQVVGDHSGEATVLNNIGAAYNDLGKKQQALHYLNLALPIKQTLGDRPGEANTLYNMGAIYADLGEKQKALSFYSRALTLWQTMSNRPREAETLNSVGRFYSDLGEKQKALSYYNQALPLWQTTGDRAGEADTLTCTGKVYSDLGEKQKALSYYSQALPLWRAVGNRAGEAITLNNIGSVYSDLGEKQKALSYYNQALPLKRTVGNRDGEAITLDNIGSVYSDLGEKQKALSYYSQALSLQRTVGDRTGEATTLNNIGKVYSDLGEEQQALDSYDRSLTLHRAVSDRGGEATTLNNIGLVYWNLGESQKALDYYNQALPLQRAVSDRAGEALALNNIGAVYRGLQESQKALEYYNQALPLWQTVGNRDGEATTLNNIGRVHDDLGEKQQALESYSRALPLLRVVGDRGGEARTLTNMGELYTDMGARQKALDFLNQALPLTRAVGDRDGEAVTLDSLGEIYAASGEKQQALNYYNQALPIVRDVGDRAEEAVILGHIAIVERQRGQLKQARAQMQAALELVESLRTNVASQALRSTYFSSQQGAYKFYIDLLMQLHQQEPDKGYSAEALQISERTRARSLLELLTEAHTDIRQGADQHMLQQERTLQQQLDATEQHRVKLLNGQYTNKQLDDLKHQTEALLAQLEEVKAQIRLKSPRYANLKYPQPLTLLQLQQQVLDNNTLLLEYSLGDGHSYLWAVTKTDITSYQLPKRADIETAAQEFSQQLHSPTENNSAVGQKLSQMLLSAVAPKLGQKRLLIVGDGPLQSLPFAALPIPESGQLSESRSQAQSQSPSPLLVAHEIVTLPSASTLAVLRHDLKDRPVAVKTLAAIADPVFTQEDERLKVGAQGSKLGSALTRSAADIGVTLDRLKYSRTEAEQILKLVPATERQQAFDFDASRATATSPDLAKYQIIHFATHGLLDNIHPELSGLVLSLVNATGAETDGFLRLHDIYNLNLPAELVVLSACETGLGKDVRGEGLVGLTRGFMYAGAKRVVVSLWSVNDRATAELMQRFYQRMLQKGLKPAAALRAAQLEMWRTQQWHAPYYWAAFVVQGEWK